MNFRQQNAVGHHFHQRAVLHAIGEANFVTDQLADFGFEFLRQPHRDTARGDTSRLSATDRAVNAALEFEAHLRQLRGFSRAGLATDNHHLVCGDGSRDLRAALGDGQGIVVDWLWKLILAMFRDVARDGYLL